MYENHITIGASLVIISCLLYLGYYIGKVIGRVDEIGYMVALLLDYLEVPGCTSEDCEIQTISDLQEMVDVRRNDTLLRGQVITKSNVGSAELREIWESWDKEGGGKSE